jgi:hypothetical protein
LATAPLIRAAIAIVINPVATYLVTNGTTLCRDGAALTGTSSTGIGRLRPPGTPVDKTTWISVRRDGVFVAHLDVTGIAMSHDVVSLRIGPTQVITGSGREECAGAAARNDIC